MCILHLYISMTASCQHHGVYQRCLQKKTQPQVAVRKADSNTAVIVISVSKSFFAFFISIVYHTSGAVYSLVRVKAPSVRVSVPLVKIWSVSL